MIDLIVFLLFAFVFMCGVQVGAWFGGLPQWIRWCADRLERALKKAKPDDVPK